MKNKYYYLLAVVFFIMIGLGFSMIVSADDDHDHDEEYEDYEEENYFEQSPTSLSKEYWYKWSRVAIEPLENEELPVNESSEIMIKTNNENNIKVFAVAENSQLMVPIKETAGLLGANVVVYPNSEIIEINKDNRQLIVRKGTKVVYENMMKTPMQMEVKQYNEKYYIAISVLANGLGYEINERVSGNEIKLERVDQL